MFIFAWKADLKSALANHPNASTCSGSATIT